MKKNIIKLIAGLFVLSNAAFAQPNTCGFQDNVRVQGPSGTHLMSLEVHGLDGDWTSNSSFVLGDNGNCGNGMSYVTVGTDDTHYVVVNLSDGPWKFVNVDNFINHNGFEYVGLQQVSRHDYILFFNQSLKK